MIVAINYKHIGKLGHGDAQWKTFNNTFENVDISVAELADAISDGHAHCACHYHISHQKEGKDRDGRSFTYNGAYRDMANFYAMQTACLDFDGMKPEDSIPALLMDTLIGRHAAILYATTSSVPSAPRTRVVFVLEQPLTDAQDARLFNKALTEHYPRADKSGSDVMKAWSGSLNCELYLNENAVIPDNIVRGMVWQARRREEELKERRRRFLDGMSEDDMSRKLREALRFVPAQMEYRDWVNALMAIWTLFPNERGVAIAEEWSPGYEGEVAKKFRSFRDVQIPPDWIFAVAYRRGWRDERMPDKGDIVSLILKGVI